MKHVLALSGSVALLLATSGTLLAAAAPKPDRPLLFAAYYVWYHTGGHPRQPWAHWTYPAAGTNALAIKAQRPGEPPPASAARPLAGLYDSADPLIAEWLTVPGVDSFGFYGTFSHFRANRYEELAGKYRYLVKQAHEAGKKMLLPIHPGHDNSHFSETPYVMPRGDGQTLRDFLRAATHAHADFILVTSFNEWPETTVVEPSSSWPDPYQYLKILADWKGLAFATPIRHENNR
jgi:hypothetical protein